MSPVKTWRLLLAIAHKELLQILRDRLTLALLVAVPLAQILLFGLAIELAPRHWPTAWVSAASQDTVQERAARRWLADKGWLQVHRESRSITEARGWMQRGEVRFIVVWPEEATTATPVRLLADLSDPFAAAALSGLAQEALGPEAKPPLPLAVEIVHAARRSAGDYLVPALAGVILTLTLTLMAALSLVREVERGTWHGLLTTPAGAVAIIGGKLACYLGLGALLYLGLSALAAGFFHSPVGSPALALVALLFMLANLGLGLCLSLLARTQMQAMQLGVFFYLPSLLLSGFMFPFHAMPAWARSVGELLPLTHFLRCLRAALIRSADAAVLAELAWPIAVFAAVALLLAGWGARRRIGG